MTLHGLRKESVCVGRATLREAKKNEANDA